MFTPEALQTVIEGTQEIDVDELQKTARYEGYNPEDRTIKDFWTIVREFTVEQRRHLLAFVTASERVPVNGLGSIAFIIQRNGSDTDVCFRDDSLSVQVLT